MLQQHQSEPTAGHMNGFAVSPQANGTGTRDRRSPSDTSHRASATPQLLQNNIQNQSQQQARDSQRLSSNRPHSESQQQSQGTFSMQQQHEFLVGPQEITLAASRSHSSRPLESPMHQQQRSASNHSKSPQPGTGGTVDVSRPIGHAGPSAVSTRSGPPGPPGPSGQSPLRTSPPHPLPRQSSSLNNNEDQTIDGLVFGDAILCGSHVGIVRYHGPLYLDVMDKSKVSDDMYIGMECCSEEETNGEGHDGWFQDFRYFDTTNGRKTGILISEREFTRKLPPFELLQTIEKQKKKTDGLLQQNKLLWINLEALLLHQHKLKQLMGRNGKTSSHAIEQMMKFEIPALANKARNSNRASPSEHVLDRFTTTESLESTDLNNVTMRGGRKATLDIEDAAKNLLSERFSQHLDAAQISSAMSGVASQHISAQSGAHSPMVSGALSLNSEPNGNPMAPIDPPALMTRKAHSKVQLSGVMDGVATAVANGQQSLQQQAEASYPSHPPPNGRPLNQIHPFSAPNPSHSRDADSVRRVVYDMNSTLHHPRDSARDSGISQSTVNPVTSRAPPSPVPGYAVSAAVTPQPPHSQYPYYPDVYGIGGPIYRPRHPQHSTQYSIEQIPQYVPAPMEHDYAQFVSLNGGGPVTTPGQYPIYTSNGTPVHTLPVPRVLHEITTGQASAGSGGSGPTATDHDPGSHDHHENHHDQHHDAAVDDSAAHDHHGYDDHEEEDVEHHRKVRNSSYTSKGSRHTGSSSRSRRSRRKGHGTKSRAIMGPANGFPSRSPSDSPHHQSHSSRSSKRKHDRARNAKSDRHKGHRERSRSDRSHSDRSKQSKHSKRGRSDRNRHRNDRNDRKHSDSGDSSDAEHRTDRDRKEEKYRRDQHSSTRQNRKHGNHRDDHDNRDRNDRKTKGHKHSHRPSPSHFDPTSEDEADERDIHMMSNYEDYSGRDDDHLSPHSAVTPRKREKKKTKTSSSRKQKNQQKVHQNNGYKPNNRRGHHSSGHSQGTEAKLKRLLRTDTALSVDTIETVNKSSDEEQDKRTSNQHTSYISILTDTMDVGPHFSINDPSRGNGVLAESGDDEREEQSVDLLSPVKLEPIASQPGDSSNGNSNGRDGRDTNRNDVPGLESWESQASSIAGPNKFGNQMKIQRNRHEEDEMLDDESMTWSEGSSEVNESSVVYAQEEIGSGDDGDYIPEEDEEEDQVQNEEPVDQPKSARNILSE